MDLTASGLPAADPYHRTASRTWCSKQRRKPVRRKIGSKRHGPQRSTFARERINTGTGTPSGGASVGEDDLSFKPGNDGAS